MVERDRDAAESIIEATLQDKEKELAAAEQVVGILNGEWHAGNLDITQETFTSEIEKLERRITSLKGDTVVIRTSRHELSGRMLDDMIWRQDRENADWAYLDLLISRYKTPEGARLSLFAPRDADAQQRFRAKVLKAYGAADGHAAWCAISGQWHDASLIKAAHIVRYNVGEPSAQHLFGPSNDKDGHLMGAKNGIPIHQVYEQALDEARLVIVPDGDQENGQASTSGWKVYWLYEADAKKRSLALPSGSELHGRSLQFQNDFRPAARYLYFAFCMSILRRQRHDVPGWWRDYLIDGVGKVWATPGSYLRNSTLRKIAHQVGHLTEEEASIFAAEGGSGRTTDPADEDEDEVMDSTHSSVISSACASQASPTPST
ncbi:uncharacterized protein TrAFT101_000272 [Trichoderma asperellum]|uniref:uncharacterized protein n=1 Tax=Trichoderma asperellum TaxID=101201 RepID=UPI00331D4645|nr:hypothetical protein TrAFT101_000272 [Trichoderma asperellum]